LIRFDLGQALGQVVTFLPQCHHLGPQAARWCRQFNNGCLMCCCGLKLGHAHPQRRHRLWWFAFGMRAFERSAGRGAMTTYIMLANWTDRGLQAVTDGPKRLDNVKKMLADMGGRMQSLYLTMGQYDLVGIFDAPDDAIAARFILMLGQVGNVRTVTMKAFPEEAYRQIIASFQ
jgi:uncharacterized protein with GYD domain